MTIYLVVDGDSHQLLLEALLPGDVKSYTTISAAENGSLARSKAGTLMLSRAEPVVLLVDANTTDETAIAERHRMLHSILTGYSPDPDLPFAILLAVPELEIIFVYHRTVLEHLMGRVVTEAEYRLAQKSPVEFLSPDFDKTRFDLNSLLKKLTPADIDLIRQHPLMVSLLNFLRQAVPARE